MKISKNPRGKPKVGGPSKADQILKLFPEDGSGLWHRELKKKALEQGISPNTLYGYLKKLREAFIVLKYPETVKGKIRVCYKLLTKEDFLETDEFSLPPTFPFEARRLVRSEEIPNEIAEQFDRSLIQKGLAYFLACLLQIGEKATTIKDYKKKIEFVNVAVNFYIQPILRMFSDLGITSEHWKAELYTARYLLQNSDKTFSDRVKKLLPIKLSNIFLEAFKDLQSGNVMNARIKMEELKKELRKSEVIERR